MENVFLALSIVKLALMDFVIYALLLVIQDKLLLLTKDLVMLYTDINAFHVMIIVEDANFLKKDALLVIIHSNNYLELVVVIYILYITNIKL